VDGPELRVEVPSNSLERSKRLERIKEYIRSLDMPGDSEVGKLRLVFDLIDEEIVHEYDRELHGLEKINLEKGCLSSLSTRRSEIEILAYVLKVAREGANKTKILYKANLSYTQLRNYLRFLKAKGLIREEAARSRGVVFKTTSKGNLFLIRWMRILDLFEQELHEEPLAEPGPTLP